MADGDGRVAVQQHERHRLADDVAAADDDRVLPRDGDAGAIQQLMMPAGVHARRTARFWTSRPTFCGLNPSTSFSGAIVVEHEPLGGVTQGGRQR